MFRFVFVYFFFKRLNIIYFILNIKFLYIKLLLSFNVYIFFFLFIDIINFRKLQELCGKFCKFFTKRKIFIMLVVFKIINFLLVTFWKGKEVEILYTTWSILRNPPSNHNLWEVGEKEGGPRIFRLCILTFILSYCWCQISWS